MAIKHIVARDINRCIGKNNKLPWHFPADLTHFKNLTTGQTVVMGRKTYESIGKLLPNRVNRIVTRDRNLKVEGAEIYYSIEKALENYVTDDLYVIGGSNIYEQTLQYAEKIEETIVPTLVTQGDAWYPTINMNDWKITSEREEDGLIYSTLSRI